eukprot:1858229-Prymnesium_polylepis.3
MGVVHEMATPVVMQSLAASKFPRIISPLFGDGTWKPDEVSFVLAVQYQVGGGMVIVLSWMFFMAAKNPSHYMLAHAGILLSALTALGAMLIAFSHPDHAPVLFKTPMLPVWTAVTGIGLVGALTDKRASADKKSK